MRSIAVLVVLGAVGLGSASAQSQKTRAARLPNPVPAITDAQLISGALTPPSEAACFAIGRRCFTASAMQNSYNLPPLYAAGDEGQGATIAIIDSFGNPNMASDLANFDTHMGLPHMCGEPGAASGWFRDPDVPARVLERQDPGEGAATEEQGHRPASPEPLGRWKPALDVEWAHPMAPKANIINVTTNPAEVLGVQGFPAMMNAEQFIVAHHEATVITQGFGAAEESFHTTTSLLNLRHAFISAAANGVTVLASSGDFGTANPQKDADQEPENHSVPDRGVWWPVSRSARDRRRWHLPLHRSGHRDGCR